MADFQFEYYVLNYDFNRKKIVPFNIFNNFKVQEWVETAVKEYLADPENYRYERFHQEVSTGFDALCDEIDSNIRWQECARCEYEIGVGSIFENDCNNLEKWDCYKQCKLNIRMIARECIYQYQKWLEEK